MSQFKFQVKYRSGRTNANADTLSRNPVDIKDAAQELTQSSPLHDIARVQVKMANVRSTTTLETPPTTTTLPGYKQEKIAELQVKDPTIGGFARNWRYGTKPTWLHLKHESNAVRALVRRWDRVIEKEGVLYIKCHDPLEGERHQLLLPAELQPMVLEALHNQAGHQGQERTLALLQKRCWWPGISTDVEKWCKSCERCTVAKAPTPRVRPTIDTLQADKLLDILAIASG